MADQVAAKEYYGALIRTLEQIGGYAPGAPGEKLVANNPQYHLFVYDWREDIVQTVRKLDELIEQVRKDYQSPDLKEVMVAHSIDGFISRIQ